MPRNNSGIPPYPSRPHSSGQARITIRRKDFYLGEWGSEESKRKYARTVAEQLSQRGPEPIVNKDGTTVEDLLAQFLADAMVRYVKNGKQTSEVGLFKAAMAPVFQLYGDILAKDFGPLALGICRDELAKKHCRKKVNQHVGRIRRIWGWAVEHEIVKVEVWLALKLVKGLRMGQAPDRPKIKPVADERVDALAGHVLPPVWAMIQLQRWTAMRPGEVVQMRTCDIVLHDPELPPEVRGLCWVYRPASHKTEHHEKARTILLGPHAQELLRAWMRPAEPEAFLFSPHEAVEFSRAQRKKQAKTHKRGFKRKSRPQRAPKQCYDAHAYATAIERGCERAFGMPANLSRWAISQVDDIAQRQQLTDEARAWRQANCWAPNQLRHNAATWIREHYDREVARIVLGHAEGKTTAIYAEEDVKKAARAMAAIG